MIKIKKEMDLTPKQQIVISQFLTKIIQQIDDENRIGKKHFKWDLDTIDGRLEKIDMKQLIFSISENIWECPITGEK